MPDEPPPVLPGFDPDAPAEGHGLFGLPHGVEEAAVRVVPAPWEGTVSSGRGAAGGPAAVLEASRQVDLHHLVHGDRTWRAPSSLPGRSTVWRGW